jgi:nitrous oxide reductase accessory protein NosL
MRKFYEVDVICDNGVVNTNPRLFRSKEAAERLAKELGGRVRHTTWQLRVAQMEERDERKTSQGS